MFPKADNCPKVPVYSNKITYVAAGGTILAMLCEEGRKLNDILAEASTRFSDYPAADVKQMPMADRLKAEKLHLEQQEALSAFTRHVEACSACSEGQ